MISPGHYLHTDGPPPGVSARDWAIHEANVQQFGPLPLPVKFWNNPAASRRIATYPNGTFPRPEITAPSVEKTALTGRDLENS